MQQQFPHPDFLDVQLWRMQDEPLIISSWDEWLGLKSLFVYLVDLNEVEWAQGPIILHDYVDVKD